MSQNTIFVSVNAKGIHHPFLCMINDDFLHRNMMHMVFFRLFVFVDASVMIFDVVFLVAVAALRRAFWFAKDKDDLINDVRKSFEDFRRFYAKEKTMKNRRTINTVCGSLASCRVKFVLTFRKQNCRISRNELSSKVREKSNRHLSVSLQFFTNNRNCSQTVTHVKRNVPQAFHVVRPMRFSVASGKWFLLPKKNTESNR